MFIQRLVLVLAAVAAAAPLPAQTLVTNGGFKLTSARIGDGSLPPNELDAWQAAYGTPQVIVAKGCGDPNYIAMSGNQVVGEAIRQPVALMKGVDYNISLCARVRKGDIPNAHVELRASTTPLGSPTCPAATCEAMTGAKNITETDWKEYQFPFTPSRNYTYLTISTSNDVAVDDGSKISWAEVDNVSIMLAVSPGKPAPLINAGTRNVIGGQYIVLFKRGTRVEDAEALEKEVNERRGKIFFLYRAAVLGFAAHLKPDVLKMVRANPHVLWVEADQIMRASTETKPSPDMGIDRIDQRLRPLDRTFQYTETGAGVHAYLLDTAILTTHPEFGNRASSDFTAISDGIGDCAAHGTHVAGILGGNTYGVASKARLHSVRVIGCDERGRPYGEESGAIAGVDWVTAQPDRPAVANMSISGEGVLPSLDAAVTASINLGITYVVAAHNRARDACNYSPARVTAAITVGAVNTKTDDKKRVDSNYGPCVDLFAPGGAIPSADSEDVAATASKSGTSMAAAHVAGVAAFYLQRNPLATPSDVWNQIHSNNNVATTPNWPGILDETNNSDPISGSPNELLHWGPLGDGYDHGNPRITTVDGTRYNFQSAGEFVLLRGGAVEIQTRQTPVSTTTDLGPDPYHGLATCVSLNTALAVRVGSHRVTYQPNLDAVSDPGGLQLRINGNLAPLNAEGINLEGGGRVVKTAVGDGLEIQFPDDTILTAVPGWWASQQKWFLNIHVNRTRAAEGIMGAIAKGSWLPARPSGESLGSMPESLDDKFTTLYQTFADAWRVTPASSLFDHANETPTSSIPTWPPKNPPCTLVGEVPAEPAGEAIAEKACSDVLDEDARTACVLDVRVTGELEFARAYLLSQQLRFGATSIVVTPDRDSSAPGETVTFTATVALLTPATPANSPNVIPTGTVQFFLDREKVGEQVQLDANGRASWTTSQLLLGTHRISARYSQSSGSVFLMSSSADRAHTTMSE